MVISGGRTIDSEDFAELWHIRITVVDHNDPPEENIPSIGNPVTDRELYDGQVWEDYGIDPRKLENHQ